MFVSKKKFDLATKEADHYRTSLLDLKAEARALHVEADFKIKGMQLKIDRMQLKIDRQQDHISVLKNNESVEFHFERLIKAHLEKYGFISKKQTEEIVKRARQTSEAIIHGRKEIEGENRVVEIKKIVNEVGPVTCMEKLDFGKFHKALNFEDHPFRGRYIPNGLDVVNEDFVKSMSEEDFSEMKKVLLKK